MQIKRILLLLPAMLLTITLYAQNNDAVVNDSTAYAIIENSKQAFPKFYREFQSIKTQDELIKKFVFIRKKATGPAFAAPSGTITINLEYLQSPKPNFDDNRLIVVLYHEVGHLHYFINTDKANRNPENSEKAAFEYSLLKTKELAEKGDCLPLISGLKFMKLRSMSNDLRDAHVRALKRMVNEPLYAEYVKYANDKCKAGIE